MTDRPIIFSAPMVRALLDGRKTQTRRMLKPLGDNTHLECTGRGDWFWWTPGVDRAHVLQRIPYAPGDRLYVREAWRAEAVYDDTRPRDIPADACMVRYEADGTWTDNDTMTHAGRLRPSIFLPRWASRITRTVTEVRVQRLQEISEADVLAEGCPLDPFYNDTTADGSNPHMVKIDTAKWISPCGWYHRLWDSLHGPDAWDANPWVVAVSFTVEKRNIDAEADKGAA